MPAAQLIRATLALAALLAAQAGHAQSPSPQLVQAALRDVAQVIANGCAGSGARTGTAFVWPDSTRMVTARHVVAGCSNVRVQFPGGHKETVAYLADLKLGREVRHRLTRYLLAMSEHLNVPSGCGYAVVMDGTRSTPDRYTGRWGVPSFQPQAKVTVLTLQTRAGSAREGPDAPAAGTPEQAVVPLAGQPQLRSELIPRQLCWGSARGLLEDTRRGKRLLHDDGREMRAAHISGFRYQDEREAAALLEQAAYECAAQGIPTLFVCIPEGRAQRLLPHLKSFPVNPAPATVYAVGFPPGWTEWWVDSAEI